MLCFLMAFLLENAYNIERRVDAKFQPPVDWMKFPLDIEEKKVTCPSSIHRDSQVASSTSTELEPPTKIEVLPPLPWKRLHPKVSKPSSIAAQHKSVYKIPSGTCKENMRYNKDIIRWFQKIDAQRIAHPLLISNHLFYVQSTSNYSLQHPSSFL